MEGFFYMAYTGNAGTGFGLLAFTQGVVVGADVAGSTYEGSYTNDRETLNFSLIMKAPAGIMLVQNGVPLAAPMQLPIRGVLSRADLEAGNPVLIETDLGPVNAIFKKISDFPPLPTLV
jgi:hypothetical protein